jgi:chromosome partitioning protein
MLLVAVYSEKGGVGKTSITNGLASTAAADGMEVLVVDTDPRHTATDELGVEDLSQILTINDLLVIPSEGPIPNPADVIWQVIQPSGALWPDNVHVIPAERNLSHREMDPQPWERRLGRGIAALNGKVDLVLFDVPPRAGGKIPLAVLGVARKVLYPATLTTDGFEGVVEAKRTVSYIQADVNPELQEVGIVLSDVPGSGARRKIHDDIEATILSAWPGQVLDVQVPHRAIRETARKARAPITSERLTGLEVAHAADLRVAYRGILDHLKAVA